MHCRRMTWSVTSDFTEKLEDPWNSAYDVDSSLGFSLGTLALWLSASVAGGGADGLCTREIVRTVVNCLGAT